MVFQPIQKGVKAILKIECPRNLKKVWGFITAINVIRNYLPNCAETMAPINMITKNYQPFFWGGTAASLWQDKGCKGKCYCLHFSQPRQLLHLLPGCTPEVCHGSNVGTRTWWTWAWHHHVFKKVQWCLS
jgi:hypothetical protein